MIVPKQLCTVGLWSGNCKQIINFDRHYVPFFFGCDIVWLQMRLTETIGRYTGKIKTKHGTTNGHDLEESSNADKGHAMMTWYAVALTTFWFKWEKIAAAWENAEMTFKHRCNMLGFIGRKSKGKASLNLCTDSRCHFLNATSDGWNGRCSRDGAVMRDAGQQWITARVCMDDDHLCFFSRGTLIVSTLQICSYARPSFSSVNSDTRVFNWSPCMNDFTGPNYVYLLGESGEQIDQEWTKLAIFRRRPMYYRAMVLI